MNDDYVAGDVNQVDDVTSDDVYDGDNVEVEAPTAVAALTYIAQALADAPEAVSVSLSEKSGKVVLSLGLDSDDVGRVIGRRGRTAQAIRSLVAAAGARDGVTTSVDILD
jgi:predicted RNA-binding protein YlqC (UPF0109 family)